MSAVQTRREFLRTTTLAGLAAATFPAVALEQKPITVGLVGVAHIHTPGFVSLLKTRKDVRVKSVWDPEMVRADKPAQELSARVVKQSEQIWSDPEISAVVICSQTNRHHDLVIAGAKAGKHLFVEKPLGMTAQDSLAMAKAIEQAKVLFTTGYFMRTDAKHLFLKEQIASGNFGRITRARGSNCHSGALGGWFDKEYRWMADPKVAGVGAFGDLGTHKLDLLMWLLGEVDSVTAQLQTVTGRYGDCDETGEGLIRFKSGVIATLAAGWVDVEDPVQLVISGTEGHAAIVDNYLYYKSKKLAGTDSKEPYTQLPPAPRAPMHQFLDAVGGMKNQPLVSPREAAARVAVMEAMYRGARQRKWITVA
jgi:predicted dehydrogenase